MRSIIDTVVRRNDQPFAWPHSTCLSPVIDLFRELTGAVISGPFPFMQLGEKRAAVIVKRQYDDRWFLPLRDEILDRKLGSIVTDVKPGDTVEFVNDYFQYPPCCRSGIGIIYNDMWLYSKGMSLVLPIPFTRSEIITIVRPIICPQL